MESRCSALLGVSIFAMPKKVENKLKRKAASKGLRGKRKAAYVYGTMNKLGLLARKPKG